MSQPQRLVLELLLQEAVPDKLDTTNHEHLVKRLVDKGLAPADHPRVAAALAALQSTGSAEEPPQLERRLPDANPDDLTEESPETSASDDNPSDNDAINFDSLLSGFNSEGCWKKTLRNKGVWPRTTKTSKKRSATPTPHRW